MTDADTVFAITILVLVHTIPGCLIAVHFRGLWGDLRPTERLAISVALSIGLLLTTGLLLVRFDLFSRRWLWSVSLVQWTILVVLALKPIARLVRRFSWRMPTWPELLRSLAVLVVLVAITVPYARTFASGLPASPAGWRYVADATDLIVARGVPDVSMQWGVERPFAVSKVAGSVSLGAAQVLAGWGELAMLQWGPLLYLGVAVVGAWVFFRRISGTWGALAATAVLFAGYPFVRLVPSKLSQLTIEGIGFGLALLALWALIAADGYNRIGLRWLAGGLLLLTALTHGVAALIVGLAMVSYILARWITGRNDLRTTALTTAVALVLPGLVFISGLAIGSNREISGGLSGYELVDGTGDPTRALSMAVQGRSIHLAPPPPAGLKPSPLESLDDLTSRSFANSTRVGRALANQPIVVVSMAIAAIVAGWLLAPALRPGFLAIGIFGTALYALGPLFALRYDIWIYSNHAARREYGYFAVALLTLALMFFTALWHRLPWRPVRLLIAVGIIVVVAGAYVNTLVDSQEWSRGTLSDDEVAALDWVAANASPDAVVLTNTRTAGTLTLYAGAFSLTEGGTPYLFPDLLTHSLALLDDGQAWFATPNRELLTRHDVDYVVAVSGRNATLAGNVYAPLADTSSLDGAPFLVERIRLGNITIYESRASE